MKFNKKVVVESLDQKTSGKKVFTEGKKQEVILSEEQFTRLMESLSESKNKQINLIIKESYSLIRKSIINESLDLVIGNYSNSIVKEGFNDGGNNPGVSAANGLENVISSIKKAYEMIQDGGTRKRLANSMTKLGNFMTITADAIGSGRDQRAPADSDSLRKALPYPELDEMHHEEEVEEGTGASSSGAFVAPLAFTEGKKKDHDGDGDIDSDDYLASKDKAIKKSMKEDSGHDEAMNYGRDEGHDDEELYNLKHEDGSEDHIDDLEDDMHFDRIHDSENIEESNKNKGSLIQEEIRKMKKIINPIAKI